jgi:hypothetical protein
MVFSTSMIAFWGSVIQSKLKALNYSTMLVACILARDAIFL